MQAAPTRTIFAEITDFLATNPTPEAIIAYELPGDLQTRAHTLLEKNGEGTLTPQEQAEMMDFARIETMLLLLKAKMKRKLQDEA